MEQRRNEGSGETGDPRENPPTSGIIPHNSHWPKCGMNRPGIEPGSLWWEASSLTAQPPWRFSQRSSEVKMERRRNAWVGETGGVRENPPTGGIVWHDCHMRISGSDSALVRLAQPQWPQIHKEIVLL
ncbi:hypothetical protein PR048_031009 [Dryococelus australis]|uniref:Uncharacterized protein n=1 Tax=Dryococelus australis TaxID=614101 RepID=A0ABQ9G440_9NEOP|nr:hypothetical protein PR048_031009 [Dryococelus australis]